MTNNTTLKPMTILKRFFAPDSNVSEMTAMLKGFSRPLKDDAAYVWLVEEAARELGISVDWSVKN